MDPNAALVAIRELVAAHEADDGERVDTALNRLDSICELFGGLDEWLSKGGFRPADWEN